MITVITDCSYVVPFSAVILHLDCDLRADTVVLLLLINPPALSILI